MTRTLAIALAVLTTVGFLLAGGAARSAIFGGNRGQRVSDLITEIDLAAAEKLLTETDSGAPAVAFERARLAVYRGDCVLGSALLSGAALSETKEGAALKELAENCARATVSGFVIEDKERGIWLRLQDDADRALAPFIFDVAARARDAVSKQVGVDLPRPLRIDLVRDLFSLSAVSGLPLSAAETTGTLAVARWGRVIMLSPRAAALGYPWEDTLAHEITHLIVTRATRDHAPLWLQEGMAKRLESSWRDPRPFDDPEWAHGLAYRALMEGRAVGIDRLGPSIAMLPTPEAASIAFAEVTSFVEYFIARAGEPALKLLFADLRGSGQHGADVALRSITGRTLSEWNEEWQKALASGEPPKPPTGPGHAALNGREVARRARLSDLLRERAHSLSAADAILPVVTPEQTEPSIRYRAARALLDAGDPARADASLGALTEIAGTYGPWFALHGARLRRNGDEAGADRAFRVAIAVDPLSEDVACEGERALPGQDGKFPALPEREALCRSVRRGPAE